MFLSGEQTALNRYRGIIKVHIYSPSINALETATEINRWTDRSNNNARLLPLCYRALVLGSGGQPAVRIVTPDAASAPEDAMVPRISYDISESYL